MTNELLISEQSKCNYIIILQWNCRLLEGPFIAVGKSGRITFCTVLCGKRPRW